MKDGKIFVDTNILLYAYDNSAGEKHVKAAAIIRDLWNSGHGIASTQVPQEFFVNVTRKIPQPLAVPIARGIIKDLLQWKIVAINGETILEAVDIHKEHKFSFWDSMIIASALKGRATTILSEDFSDQQKIKGITFTNPL